MVVGCISLSTLCRWMIADSTSRFATSGKHHAQEPVCGRLHGIPRHLSQARSVLLLPRVAPYHHCTRSRLHSCRDDLVFRTVWHHLPPWGLLSRVGKHTATTGTRAQ